MLIKISDIPDINFVVNFDYPNSGEDYIHRIGRTARAQRTGTAYTFFTSSNGKNASELVQVMQEAHQVVPPKLADLAKGHYGGRKRVRYSSESDDHGYKRHAGSSRGSSGPSYNKRSAPPPPSGPPRGRGGGRSGGSYGGGSGRGGGGSGGSYGNSSGYNQGQQNSWNSSQSSSNQQFGQQAQQPPSSAGASTEQQWAQYHQQMQDWQQKNQQWQAWQQSQGGSTSGGASQQNGY